MFELMSILLIDCLGCAPLDRRPMGRPYVEDDLHVYLGLQSSDKIKLSAFTCGCHVVAGFEREDCCSYDAP